MIDYFCKLLSTSWGGGGDGWDGNGGMGLGQAVADAPVRVV